MQTESIQDAHQNSAAPTIIHLGAGRCSELASYLDMQPGQLLLVEADQRLATLLRERVAQQPHVEVRCAAVAAQKRTATFYRYNLADAGSLHPATGLRNLYPGLRVVEEATVTVDSAAELLESVQLDQTGRHLLAVDIPGEELAVLQSLEAAGLLAQFSQLRLYCGVEPLYEGSATTQTMIAWLEEHGFDLEYQDAERDPDRPCWLFRRNQIKMQMVELTLQFENTQAARDQQSKLAQEFKQQLEDLTKVHEELLANRDFHVQESAGRQQQIAQLTASLEHQNTQAQQLKQQLEQASVARDEQARLAAESQAELEKVKVALQDTDNRKNQLEAQLAELQHRQQLMNEEMVKAEGQIELIKDLLLREPCL